MELLSIEKASKVMGITYNHLRKGVLSGRYPFIRSGNKKLVNPEVIIECIKKEMYETCEAQKKLVESIEEGKVISQPAQGVVRKL